MSFPLTNDPPFAADSFPQMVFSGTLISGQLFETCRRLQSLSTGFQIT